MNRMDLKRASYLFEGIRGQILPENLIDTIRSFIAAENLYSSATREIATKLENLNSEFNSMHERNPIHLIQTRVKTPASIMEKLKRRGFELSVESARKNLTDIAGVRVICSYINDIYMISGFLLSQSDIQLVRTTDYIKNPKPNGYRSLHHIVKVPVFLSNKMKLVNVEIQIRTIAMDFWASLEHELAYKLEKDKSAEAFAELKTCAAEIADIDRRMQKLYDITADQQVPTEGDLQK
ncbi:MAG: GTP pyrophosphokinase family protein [Bacteroidales bacterium]|jgi:putative GTP pyrophosphokinase|nr:GTP pyrophosphokinase family protein [Bacteroidales bacterium]